LRHYRAPLCESKRRKLHPSNIIRFAFFQSDSIRRHHALGTQARANLETKRKALQHPELKTPGSKRKAWKQTPGLMAWLDSL